MALGMYARWRAEGFSPVPAKQEKSRVIQFVLQTTAHPSKSARLRALAHLTEV